MQLKVGKRPDNQNAQHFFAILQCFDIDDQEKGKPASLVKLQAAKREEAMCRQK